MKTLEDEVVAKDDGTILGIALPTRQRKICKPAAGFGNALDMLLRGPWIFASDELQNFAQVVFGLIQPDDVSHGAGLAPRP